MDITPKIDEKVNIITTYNDHYITIKDHHYHIPVFVTSDVIEETHIQPTDIEICQLSFLHDHYFDLLLLGTGKKSYFLAPKTLQLYKKYTQSIDFMPSRAAVHAFNIAIMEQRKAALIIFNP